MIFNGSYITGHMFVYLNSIILMKNVLVRSKITLKQVNQDNGLLRIDIEWVQTRELHGTALTPVQQISRYIRGISGYELKRNAAVVTLIGQH